ncbi:MAG TPA: hypothetical protein VFQ68_15915 [Streptosporangiaceae bacterium]|nr:hypothetical protein [Streptosporangiaceae bacterium]
MPAAVAAIGLVAAIIAVLLPGPTRPQTGLTGADLVYVIPVRAVRAHGPAPGRARVPGGAAGPVRTADGTLVAPGTFRVHHHD